MTRALLVIASGLAAIAISGCGNERTRPPDPLVPATPHGTVRGYFPAAGLRLRHPANWDERPGRAPLVATIGSGTAAVAIWRYPRSEALPRGTKALEAARKALVHAARKRDPALRVSSAQVTRVDGRDAIELLVTERIAGHVRRVRSVHVFAAGSEVVIDAYASPPLFDRLDRRAFRPLIASTRISAPRTS